MKTAVPEAALDQLFRQARSYNRWTPEAVLPAQLHALYDLLKFGPTSANSCPARFVFVCGADAKARLLECVSSGNKIKVQQAPVVTIVGMDLQFYDRLPQLRPDNPATREWFSKDPKGAQEAAFRNSSLQGAYLMLAARAVGLDCGPMSGFDNARVDAEFFAGTSIKSNFLCALGQGTQEQLFPRNPRLNFDDACKIL